MNSEKMKFIEDVLELCNDVELYLRNKRIVEQPMLNYYFAKLRDESNKAVLELQMESAFDEVRERDEIFIEDLWRLLERDPEFELSIYFSSCDGCGLIHDFELGWKYGKPPLNFLE